ncbi:MAG: Alpha-L-rhamnosidase [Parcubacteria group bacterium GW2011_GWA2_43_17]|nr:MAG: Alpha-L-rhamnosidase [Parcubacteria group bacterium GW2011_GWA2_43_17]KKT90661.1 MAG: Alpha-L-rhamnosidase [Parcubacteria group bacterium GW2011_GWF2_45_11]OHB44377.1 MAG: hypothetical protein A2Y13_08195 [Planctomycetes bacterium GWC2_45_44]
MKVDRLKAKWIWAKPYGSKAYNQAIVAKKQIRIRDVQNAIIRITADSFYRLLINGKWVSDGPCRSWPQHYQYDQIDIKPFLSEGLNSIEIIAIYYGVGDFHRICQMPGLLAQIDLVFVDKKRKCIVSDHNWQVAQLKAWQRNTPKISVQMSPAEYYDSRLEGKEQFQKAYIVCRTYAGPWKGLNVRDVPLLTKKLVSFGRVMGAKIVKAEGGNFCVPVARLMHIGLIELNVNVSSPCGIATIILAKRMCRMRIVSEDFIISVDGISKKNGRYTLKSGSHILTAFVSKPCYTHNKETSFRLHVAGEYELENPVKHSYENPWCFVPLNEFAFAGDDLVHFDFAHENTDHQEILRQYSNTVRGLLASIKSINEFRMKIGLRAKCLATDQMFVKDAFSDFVNRQELGSGSKFIKRASALTYDNSEPTIVYPSKQGDIELCYDLGRQNCGYYSFELDAESGVVVDICGVEYIDSNGRIQHTDGNRNGMRYITKSGINRFISFKRRSGRYLFITFRNFKRPIRIRKCELIESTYPVNYLGSFACSNKQLNEIWQISAHTLKLCMEDTFTDCPLYEQTLWVGDARNEALFAYGVFGSVDIAARCIKLAAQSLEKYPLVASQVPSSWECILSAWSFLWVLSVWDYYWYTGNVKWLKTLWPAVLKNINNAAGMRDERGLFTAPYWNMFDWAPIDQRHKTVLHNSLFFVGAVGAAIKCAEVLGDTKEIENLKQLRIQLCSSLNKLWDKDKKAFPDSIHEDNSISKSFSQHTSFLAIIYDVLKNANVRHAIKNIKLPPQWMTKVGSPFAIFYLYEALEKVGMPERVIASVYQNYSPMLEAGATTVWESFASGTLGNNVFPTRSHCHAWSSAPLYYFNRVILGVKQKCAGGHAFEISPRLCGLTWANGTVSSGQGPISVEWQRNGRLLEVKITSPKHVKVKFARNTSHKRLDIKLEHFKFDALE